MPIFFVIKYILTASLLFFAACQKVKQPYMISNFSNVQNLEKQDHKFCASLNLDSAQNNLLENETYWRCRLSLAKYHIKTDSSNPENKKFNFQITDLVSKISLDLAQKHESNFLKQIRKLSDHHHKQCVGLGFNPDTLDQTIIDDYFLCRKRLIDGSQIDPPFGNDDYLRYPNHTYEIGFVIDERLKKETKEIEAVGAEYPACSKYHLRKTNFSRCKKAQDDSRDCYATILRKKMKKEAQTKSICQKQSFIEFPNSLLKPKEQEDDLQKIKTNADIYNQSNFASIGLNEKDVAQFTSGKDVEITEETQKNVNSKDGLYDRISLTKLRQRYINACYDEADVVLQDYNKKLEQECEKLKEFTVVAE